MTTVPVTVVLTARDGERHLPSTLQSLCSQSVRPRQVVLVDDGSSDSTGALLEEFAAGTPRAELIRTSGVGVSEARNLAIGRSTSEWVAFLDHDDIWHPEKLKAQMDHLDNNPDLIGIGTWATYIGEQGRGFGRYRYGPTTRQAFQEHRTQGRPLVFLTPSLVLRRSAMTACGSFLNAAGAADDMEYFQRLGDIGTVLALPEYLVSYRLHSKSLSARKLGFQRFIFRWVQFNESRRARGQARVNLEEYSSLVRERSELVRLWYYRGTLAAGLYRAAGARLSDSISLGGLLRLAAAFALSPSFVIRKLLRQVPRGPGAA